MSKSPEIKILHVGCGGMARAWMNAVTEMDDARIVGFVDLHEENARKLADQYELDVPVFQDLNQALEKTRPDAVFDCTFPAAHSKVTCDSLQFGAHVLGEKPLADTPENALQSVQTARDTGKIYAVIQNRRYKRAIRNVRKLLQDGVIGDLHTVNCDFYKGIHFGGFRDVMEHVLLLDMAIHTFDAARFLSGTNPQTVFCHEYNPPGSWYAHGSSAMAIFEMTENVILNYRGSWCAEGLQTSWESSWRFIGTQGTCLWDGNDGIQIETLEKTAGEGESVSTMRPVEIELEEFPGKEDAHQSLIREFLDAIQGGPKPETICFDNIKSLNMVFGAVESALTGKKIDIAHPVIPSAAV
jgi:predicted dehydrogenase